MLLEPSYGRKKKEQTSWQTQYLEWLIVTFLTMGPFENGIPAVDPVPTKTTVFMVTPTVAHKFKDFPWSSPLVSWVEELNKDPDPELGNSAGRTGVPNEALLRAQWKPEGKNLKEEAEPEEGVSTLTGVGPPMAESNQRREDFHGYLEQLHLLSFKGVVWNPPGNPVSQSWLPVSLGEIRQWRLDVEELRIGGDMYVECLLCARHSAKPFSCYRAFSFGGHYVFLQLPKGENLLYMELS